jgi:hypothetical protein
MPDTNLLLDLALTVLQLTAVRCWLCPASLLLTTVLLCGFTETFSALTAVSSALSSSLTFKTIYKIWAFYNGIKTYVVLDVTSCRLVYW